MTKNQDPSEQSVSPSQDPASSDLESANTALRELDERSNEILRRVQLPDPTEATKRALEKWAKDLQGVLWTINANLQELLAPLEADYAEFVKGENIQNLIRHGWFPDPGLSYREIRQLADVFSADPERANEILLARFRDRIDDIEVEVTSAFPHRSEILRDAFQAHREGRYNLSVAVFLTQADGFCYDRWLRSLFLGEDRKDIGERIEHMSDGLIRTMSRALLYDGWPLAMTRGQRQQQPDGFTELNRHQVLHGEVTDYGSEANSLKAVSLLNYCTFVLPQPEPGPNEPNGSE